MYFGCEKLDLLFKWLWRYNEDDKQLCKEIIIVKYGRKDFWCLCPVLAAGVGLLKQICKLSPEFQQNIRWKVGIRRIDFMFCIA